MLEKLIEELKLHGNEGNRYEVNEEKGSMTVLDNEGNPLYWFKQRKDGVILWELLFLETEDCITNLTYWVDDELVDLYTAIERAREYAEYQDLQVIARLAYVIGYGDYRDSHDDYGTFTIDENN